jgi:hypothetical protein
MRSFTLLMAGLVAGTPASAAIKSSNPHGFTVVQSIVVLDRLAPTWAAFGRLEDWWSNSVRASTKSFGTFRRGSWCERLPDGRTQCMRVKSAREGQELVLMGALEPMIFGTARATMVARFTPEGPDTRVTVTYVATGFSDGNARKIAPVADKVLANQLQRFWDSMDRDD